MDAEEYAENRGLNYELLILILGIGVLSTLILVLGGVQYEKNLSECQEQYGNESILYNSNCYNYTILRKQAQLELSQHGEMTKEELHQRIGRSYTLTDKVLDRMQEDGIVVRKPQTLWMDDKWALEDEKDYGVSAVLGGEAKND